MCTTSVARNLLQYSSDTRISPAVRRAIDVQLLTRLAKLTPGERICSAKVCSRELLKKLLYEDDLRVFAAT